MPYVIVLAFLLFPLSAHAQGVFTDCVNNPNRNSVIAITTDAATDIGTGYSLKEGDEVGAFTEDGICAGQLVWEEGRQQGLSISGQDSDYGYDGFATDEPIEIRVYHQAAGEVITADVAYRPCEEIVGPCSDDGLYRDNTLYVLSSNVIPVELIAFNATLNGTTAHLEWQTATETNNAGFEVQHYQNHWETVGYIEGQGTTKTPQNYQFSISDLSPGTHAVRLVQLDYDGTSETFPEQTLHVSAVNGITEVSPHPVTTTGQVTLTLSSSQQVSAEVFNQLGQRVRVLEDGLMAAGAHELTIDATDLASGLYFLRVQTDEFSAVRDLVIIR